MLQAFVNAFKITELRKRLLFTFGILIIYEAGTYVPTPGINTQALRQFFDNIAQTQGGTLFDIMNLFSGGAMSRLTIFALGIMPNVSASIILQLLATVFPALEKLTKDELGRRKLTQYTRYGTVLIAIIQSFFIALWVENPGTQPGLEGWQLVSFPGWGFRLLTIITLTSGTALIMYLGEQITERGIGNGISLIIAAGIISSLPAAVYQLVQLVSPFSPSTRQLSGMTLIVMIALMVAVVAAVVLITQGQRQIPIQYAKRIVGRKVYGGQSTYIPLRVNQAGVIPIIFAQSILLFPATIAGIIPNEALQNLAHSLLRGNLVYAILYSLLIIFFTYFYTAITFNPIDIADNMKKYGGFVPGIRPGRATVDYLDFVMTRVALPGAIFLAVIAVLPDFIGAWLKVPYLVASFFGGTGLLIVVGVMLDTIKQIESHLLMRHYEGFMKKGRIRGRR